jgi:hypothetical protein
MYDGDGNLLYFPVDGEPVQSSIRAKSSKGKPPKLLEIGNNQPNDKESFDIPQKADDQPKQLNSPKELLFVCVQQLVFGAQTMNSWPSIKQQISQLNSSSVVAVYHQKNMTKSFRSYILPASIHEATILFL